MSIARLVEYPGLNKPAPVMGLPINLSNSENKIKKRPPTLGEDTNQILTELGFSEEKINIFRDKRII